MRTLNSFLFLVTLCLLVVLGITIWINRTKPLEVVFLDVGQGDATYIEAPNGFQVLIDGGAGGQVLGELGQVMPWFDRSIDVVIATHPDRDHIGGLFDVLTNYQVDLVLDTGFPIQDDLDAYWYDFHNDIGQLRQPVAAGQVLVLDEVAGVTLEVLHPEGSTDEFRDANDGSIVMELRYGAQEFLFMGDASQVVEGMILSAVGGVDVLKLGHHGSKTSSGEAFLRRTNPAIGIVSAGADNSYGHPHDIVTDRLAFLGIPYLCTCDVGRIRFTTNGETLRKY